MYKLECTESGVKAEVAEVDLGRGVVVEDRGRFLSLTVREAGVMVQVRPQGRVAFLTLELHIPMAVRIADTIRVTRGGSTSTWRVGYGGTVQVHEEREPEVTPQPHVVRNGRSSRPSSPHPTVPAVMRRDRVPRRDALEGVSSN